MQLRTARLCLDCEELHTGNECPVCASESFTFLTRWVPVSERRERARVSRPVAPDTSTASRWITGGVAGVVLVAAGRWLWQTAQNAQKAAQPPGQSTRTLTLADKARRTDRSATT